MLLLLLLQQRSNMQPDHMSFSINMGKKKWLHVTNIALAADATDHGPGLKITVMGE